MWALVMLKEGLHFGKGETGPSVIGLEKYSVNPIMHSYSYLDIYLYMEGFC